MAARRSSSPWRACVVRRTPGGRTRSGDAHISHRSVEALAAALRARFQPVTTARTARETVARAAAGRTPHRRLHRRVQQLHAQVSDMAEPDARAQFVRGLRRELANKLEDVDWESMPLPLSIARAARSRWPHCSSASASHIRQGDVSIRWTSTTATMQRRWRIASRARCSTRCRRRRQ